jgi:hypothetical protein
MMAPVGHTFAHSGSPSQWSHFRIFILCVSKTMTPFTQAPTHDLHRIHLSSSRNVIFVTGSRRIAKVGQMSTHGAVSHGPHTLGRSKPKSSYFTIFNLARLGWNFPSCFAVQASSQMRHPVHFVKSTINCDGSCITSRHSESSISTLKCFGPLNCLLGVKYYDRVG